MLGKRKVLYAATVTGIMSLIFLLFLFPFYIVVVNSFKSIREIGINVFALPSGLYLDNYIKAWKALNYAVALKNTFIITVFSNFCGIFIATMTGYWLTRNDNKFTRTFFALIIASMAIPFSGVMIPFVKIISFIKLYDSLPGIIFSFWGLSLPLAVFMTSGAVKSVPLEIEESALVDGCNRFRLFWGIVFPLVKSTTFTYVILNTFWFWNDFITAQLLLSSKRYRTIQLAIRSLFGEAQQSWDLALAALVLCIIPLFVFFLVMQKHIISGVIEGAVKG